MMLAGVTLFAQEPEFTKEGKLKRPADYREWIFLSSGLGMTYGAPTDGGQPRFDNVFADPRAYKAFMATGVWP